MEPYINIIIQNSIFDNFILYKPKRFLKSNKTDSFVEKLDCRQIGNETSFCVTFYK